MAKGDFKLAPNETSWLYFFVDRFRLTIILALGLFISGIYAYLTLPRELSPEVEIPIGVVTTVYPGASPEDIENLVTKEIEDKVSTLDNLDDYSSTSGSSVSSVVVQFIESADLNKSMQNLRDKVDEAKGALPDEANDPQVTEISFSSIPILTFALYGPYEPSELRGYAETLQDAIERDPEVDDAFITGAPEKQVHVIVNPFTLLGYKITVSDIVNALRAHHINFPLGTVTSGDFEWTTRFAGRFENIDEITSVPVSTTSDGQVLKIGDIATVENGFDDMNTYSRYYRNGDAQPFNTVAITVTKRSGGDIIKMGGRITKLVDELVKKEFPADLKIDLATDYGDYIREDFAVLGSNAWQSITLVFLVLFFFIGWRQASLAASTIPFAILFGMMGMQIFGFTLNNLSLFSLILTLGMLVDNGIIVQEGVHFYRKNNVEPHLSAKLSVRDYKWPILSGSLTTIAAFIPMLITPGIIGQYIRAIPIVVAMVLIGSVFSSLIINTSLSAILLHGDESHESKYNISSHFNAFFTKYYTLFVRKILTNKRVRRLTYAGIFGVWVLALMLPILGFLKVEMFSGGDYDYFYVEIEGDTGQVVDKTDELVRSIEDELIKTPEIKNFVSYTGSMNGSDVSMGTRKADSANLASITVNIAKERERTASEIVADVRERTKYLQNQAKIVFKAEEGGPSTSAPVTVRISGLDLNKMNEIVMRVQQEIAKNPSAVDVANNVEISKGQNTFRFDDYKVAKLGINKSAVMQTLRAALEGTSSIEMLLNGDKQDIIIKFSTDDFDVNSLLDMSFATATGDYVPLREFTTSILEREFSTVRHYDGERVFNVTSYLADGAAVTDITTPLEAEMKTWDWPEGYGYYFGGEMEDIEESFTAMFKAFGISMLLILLILVIQFDSFRQPFIIALSIPLSLIGVLPGLTLMGLNISFPAVIGIVALAGIAVNNAIVLIDRINSLINEHGQDPIEAAIEAGSSRIQPIFLTTFTTIVGIVPLAFSQPIWAPLSWSIGYGLLATTLLTLFYVPALYISFYTGRMGQIKIGQPNAQLEVAIPTETKTE